MISIKIKRASNKKITKVIDDPYEYSGEQYIAKQKDGTYVVVDNSHGNAFTEQFPNFRSAKNWLLLKPIRKSDQKRSTIDNSYSTYKKPTKPSKTKRPKNFTVQQKITYHTEQAFNSNNSFKKRQYHERRAENLSTYRDTGLDLIDSLKSKYKK